jgi:hypothetical protein
MGDSGNREIPGGVVPMGRKRARVQLAAGFVVIVRHL